MQQIYSRIARQRRLESYFYAAHASALPDRLANSPPSSVLVFKDGTQYRFPPMPDEVASVPVTTEPPPLESSTTPPLAHPALMAPMMDPFHPMPPVDMRLLANAPPAPTPPTPASDDEKAPTKDLPDAHKPWADDLLDWVNYERCASLLTRTRATYTLPLPLPLTVAVLRQCRFPALARAEGAQINDLGRLHGKLLVIFVTMNVSEMQEASPRALLNARFKHFAELISRQRDRFHKCASPRLASPRLATPNHKEYVVHCYVYCTCTFSRREYQFVWMWDLDTAESLLIEHIRLPCVLLYDPATRLAYANDSALQHRWTAVADVERFLSDVKAGLVPVRSSAFIPSSHFASTCTDIHVPVRVFVLIGERGHRLRGRHEAPVLRARQFLRRMHSQHYSLVTAELALSRLRQN